MNKEQLSSIKSFIITLKVGLVILKAIQLYKQALILNPKDEDTRYNLAFAQEEFRKEEEARKMLEKMNDQLKKDEKPKPSKFAEECMKKSC